MTIWEELYHWWKKRQERAHQLLLEEQKREDEKAAYRAQVKAAWIFFRAYQTTTKKTAAVYKNDIIKRAYVLVDTKRWDIDYNAVIASSPDKVNIVTLPDDHYRREH